MENIDILARILHFPFSIIIEFFQNEKRTKPQTAR